MSTAPLTLRADVLVIGGGMAAAWAALAAAEAGAAVIVVDKGAMGTSGVTATGGPGHWFVPPEGRAAALERQVARTQGLAEAAWMERVMDLTWRHLPTIAPWYPFGSDGQGGRYIQGVRGPEYMRALRRMCVGAGIAVLDHHPALELLADGDGAVVGARGLALGSGEDWEIRAGATILATGGCAFRSGLIGSHTQTGDGLLMAAEAGALLSGMEFSISWSLSPAWASTRTLPFTAARFFREDGSELAIPSLKAGHAHYQALGAALLQGTVLADLSAAPAGLPAVLRQIQPLTVAAFERRGIDLFRQRFPVRLFGEGTIRGTGGIALADADCGTGVPGLYAAGDAATRELVAGAISGGGAVNSAWALASGRIAGAAAAHYGAAKGGRAGPARALGKAGLRPRGSARPVATAPLQQTIEHAIHGLDRALWRRASTLAASLHELDEAWRAVADHGLAADPRGRVELRATAAMAATARWCTAAAAERRETRGIAVRTDLPATDPAQARRLLVGGLDKVWTRPAAPALRGLEAVL
ncbi:MULTISPECIES: FAD-binding protein [unclassified Novosphingobium]|uniref:FAD-binding protein n=1 Tax=Novosphingobium TaxID=165696 RepID=UPI00146DCE4D|nr:MULTISPECIES: FAD-binding protein [unclassified Novosphingobium]NMN05347.1 succinate dehydrogenase/fumarate reductase flavoprotein subunit [Novosphingobium sp. SG919]NMN87642.1 succinate dehydrogenase/fumarate reductase flavoprotein subunit [Novosphingobium sp. SG916]